MRKDTLEDGRMITTLSWGLDIKVAECEEEDLKWTFADSRVNSTILMIADAIIAARWFNGKWCIEEDGTLVRPDEFVFKEENIEFRRVLLNPLSSQGNLSALVTFRKLQESLLAFDDDDKTAGIILESNQRISINGDDFCLWDVQQEYDGD